MQICKVLLGHNTMFNNQAFSSVSHAAFGNEKKLTAES
jgi:hypothetical protein